MREMYTGRKNEKAFTRAEEEGLNVDLDTRRRREAGSESESFRNQQERIDRTDCQRSSLICFGTAATGGMIDHLIDDYANQVAQKEQEIKRLSDDIDRHAEEVKRLNFRIQELTSLRLELRQQIKEIS